MFVTLLLIYFVLSFLAFECTKEAFPFDNAFFKWGPPTTRG